MQSNKLPNTAILIFANSPEEELRQKAISKDESLFEVLSQHTLKIVKKAAIPYFHISEKQQKGNSFGERFGNAIQMVFDQGFDNIITIGNDTPLLKTSHLLDANKELQVQRPVLGPSGDGGFYLLGLNKSLFDLNSFKSLPWQTRHLTSELLQLPTMAQVEVLRLPTLLDIDNIADLKISVRYARRIEIPLRNIILLLTSPTRKLAFSYKFNFMEALTERVPFNKGSPITF